jgi:hypothetical protein
MDTEIERSPMLNKRLIERRQQDVLDPTKIVNGNNEHAVVFSRIATYNGRIGIASGHIC